MKYKYDHLFILNYFSKFQNFKNDFNDLIIEKVININLIKFVINIYAATFTGKFIVQTKNNKIYV